MGDLEKSSKKRKNKALKPKKGVEIEKEDYENEKNQLMKKKKRKGVKEDNIDAVKDKPVNSERKKKKRKLKTKKGKHADKAAAEDMSRTLEDVNGSQQQDGAVGADIKLRKHKKSKKKTKKEQKEVENTVEKQELSNDLDQDDDVYCISSGDEDNSKGMKKWITKYHQSRPGLKVLQQRIDEFIVAHEEKLEQEQKEREAKIAEDGWTVVTHHKGRKKTTDVETGTTVGSVAPLVAQKQLAKKKSKEVGQDFYRFQKREAQRNEILKLQSKFEQDKKRIQQLRAARKFKPY